MSLLAVNPEFYPNIEQNLNKSEVSVPASNPIIWHDDCNDTSSFPDLADAWYTGAMGSIAAENGYIYPTDYGSATGIHGPVYYHIIDPSITISQLDWLEVELELDGSSAIGAADIMLYDSAYNRIALLEVADSWIAQDDTAAYAGWYDVDFNSEFTPKEWPADTVAEPYHETLRMNVNTSGVYASIPRVGEFKMLDYAELELERDITYLCVQFRQSASNTPIQTLRVHDIQMQYRPNPVYSWHHDGTNMSEFLNQQVHLNWYNLLNWINGTWNSSGEYLFPQSIDSDSDWHGPTYVAKLDQGHPLSTLVNFSVAIEAINDVTSYCGKHTVYLADDDFDLILGVHVNDAWNALQQGGVYGMHRYKDYTGTDNGPATAGTFTGINDTLSFRVEPEVGVYSYNPFYGETLLCEWNETEFSRNVRYVILMSAQLDANTLMPFRVHDIMLEFSNQTETEPEEDTDPPVIASLSDLTFEYGSIIPDLEWSISEANPDYYRIEVDGITLYSGPWNGSVISVELIELDIGVYNFTLFVNDTYEQYSVDSVIITIEDTIAPILNHPVNILIHPGDTDISLSWEPNDLKPDSYEIYQNGSLITTGTWNNTAAIIYNLTNLQPGAYEYQVIVYDSSGNSVSDTVLVVVEIPPDGLVLVIISIGSIGVIVIVIGVICRSRGRGASVAPGEGYQW
jgi:hypothetical protein